MPNTQTQFPKEDYAQYNVFIDRRLVIPIKTYQAVIAERDKDRRPNMSRTLNELLEIGLATIQKLAAKEN